MLWISCLPIILLQPFSHFGLDSFYSMAGFSPKVDVSENEKEIKVRAKYQE